jgi:hypothetical protein
MWSAENKMMFVNHLGQQQGILPTKHGSWLSREGHISFVIPEHVVLSSVHELIMNFSSLPPHQDLLYGPSTECWVILSGK